jgi:hypothetical protein
MMAAQPRTSIEDPLVSFRLAPYLVATEMEGDPGLERAA